jgi:transposase InsO family protein
MSRREVNSLYSRPTLRICLVIWDLWAHQRGVTLDFSRPGKPTDNAFIESYNGKFRTECFNATGS